jgi:hypothetical protein
MPSEVYLLKTAPQFDVHKWSDFNEVISVVDALFEEIKAFRAAKRVRVREADKVKRQLRVIIIDLWAAYKLSPNPYRAISRNKSDYQLHSRYRQIFLKYDYFIGVIDDLIELKYIQQKLGYRFSVDAKRTRIKATQKLIDRIMTPEVNQIVISKGTMALAQFNPELERETILLRDENDKNMEYEDNELTLLMRKNLKTINKKLFQSRIILDITDAQYLEMITKLNSRGEYDKPPLDFTNKQLHRVFNQSSFDKGGRFYGPWWQSIPKEYRKYIDINHGSTVELDYSGHHVRILYALQGLEPPEAPYDIVGFEYEDQKQAVLIMLNAFNETAAIYAMRGQGIKRAKQLVEAIKLRHQPIAHKFHQGEGLNLMNQDSILAEKVMLRMILERGAAVLPVHDSFIVKRSYEYELEEIMKEEFVSAFVREAKLKIKKTAREEREELNPRTDNENIFVEMDLEVLLEEEQRSLWKRTMWGYT